MLRTQIERKNAPKIHKAYFLIVSTIILIWAKYGASYAHILLRCMSWCITTYQNYNNSVGNWFFFNKYAAILALKSEMYMHLTRSMHTHGYIDTCTHTHSHATLHPIYTFKTHTQTHTRTHARTHTPSGQGTMPSGIFRKAPHTHTHKHTHTHAHTRTHTYTHSHISTTQ